MRSTWGGSTFEGGGSRQWLPFSLSGLPVVKTVLLAWTIVFLLYFLARTSVTWMAFSAGPDWYLRPWSLITYPLLMTGLLALLLEGFWFFVVGGNLERSWGSVNFAVLLLVFSLLASAAFVPAYYLLGSGVLLAGPELMLAALTVAWAALDPEMEVRLYGCIPVKAKLIALLSVLFAYFNIGFAYGPLMGFFALVSPAAAFYYVRKMPRLSVGFRAPRRGDRWAPDLGPGRPSRARPEPRERVNKGFNPLRRRQEQAEIERLKKLLGDDDDDRPVRN